METVAAGFFQLFLELLGVCLGEPFLDLGRHGLDQVLGFFQAQATWPRGPP